MHHGHGNLEKAINELNDNDRNDFKDYVIHYKGSHHYKEKNNLNIKDHTVYENKIYTPYITDEQVERFLRRPDTFQFQIFKIDGFDFQ